mmetsp:Transcript_23690/g.21053  ORF Transcript_23690/g.21053 Transcript_23690/m.21053 type:complete len:146 (-) Transcript_23690:338-775(-)
MSLPYTKYRKRNKIREDNIRRLRKSLIGFRNIDFSQHEGRYNLRGSQNSKILNLRIPTREMDQRRIKIYTRKMVKKRLFNKQNKAALVIQKFFRRLQAYKRYIIYKRIVLESAIKIQKCWRRIRFKKVIIKATNYDKEVACKVIQ